MSIVAKNLSFTYNKKSAFKTLALDNISLEISEGEFVAIVGHTGSGKTTFLQHLNALIRLQEGELFVSGMNLADKKVDLKKLRGTVGMVFQYPEYQLFADTVETDVGFGPKNINVPLEEIPERVKNAIELVGLDWESVKNKSPFELSGGEKRRVALAGVLAMRPRILVLDEPTAGLDPQGKREILGLIKKLNEEEKITVLMVSHDMNEVFENARRIVVFNKGKIAFDLPAFELFKKEAEIEQMNLEIPYMARIVNVLSKEGVVLGGDLRTVDDVLSAVQNFKGGRPRV